MELVHNAEELEFMNYAIAQIGIIPIHFVRSVFVSQQFKICAGINFEVMIHKHKTDKINLELQIIHSSTKYNSMYKTLVIVSLMTC
jgi:hypothetical protein